MDSKEVLEQALRLKSEERFIVVEGLLRSLDEPDRELDALWAEEAELRLRAYRSGKLAGVPLEMSSRTKNEDSLLRQLGGKD